MGHYVAAGQGSVGKKWRDTMNDHWTKQEAKEEILALVKKYAEDFHQPKEALERNGEIL